MAISIERDVRESAGLDVGDALAAMPDKKEVDAKSGSDEDSNVSDIRKAKKAG